ncbi:Heme peroxidase family protein [Lasiodiplodia theobromae]|uniref:Heme peroxidase family protein n=1 Tax=Lasiodiplodia theobromae TaxID=45133 RepID=UPI0015C31E1A|nr:Heme peroxidase family protein [Lasiodiplodia theobromae]KAF4545835.1 Heme peroxidase family protein [Lasiodiplodia theobromae]
MSQLTETITMAQRARKRATDTQKYAFDVGKSAVGAVWDLRNVLWESARLDAWPTVFHSLYDKLSTGAIDDREYLNEQVIRLAASLPNDSHARNLMSSTFVKTLWQELPHPPTSYLGDKYKYRDPDGRNNVDRPCVPYERASLLRRNGPAREHPARISSFLFYFGTIVIHDLFVTDHEGPEGTLKNSSYVDLGPLYGHNKEQQKRVRTGCDGKLKDDTFSEWRLLTQPPGVCALLIAFNRFHNYVVEELARINEGGRFTLQTHYVPDKSKSAEDQAKDEKHFLKEAHKKRDNDLFQTGRLITCGLYASIVLGDYVRTILNLNDNKLKPDSDWTLDPRMHGPNDGTPRGVGNQVSAEFNFVYRWHATISNKDEQWMNTFMKEVFPEGQVDDDPHKFYQHVEAWRCKNAKEEEPEKWTFNGMTREHGQTGKFRDDELVALLTNATRTCAGAFGARNTPAALKVIEVLGIEQGRRWGLASLNEFRNFFGLKQFSSFEEINPDPGVAQALKALYGHPDNVELYPGLMCEEAKKVCSPGSGLCPGFTISEAILADAVALVRGDRFLTIDFGPEGLTSFGFQQLAADKEVAGGGQLYKLLMRAFPGWYRPNSIYALYPFTTPQKTLKVFGEIGMPNGIELLDRDPELLPDPLPGAVQQFNDPWDRLFAGLPSSKISSGMAWPNDEQISRFYEGITRDLICEKALQLQDNKCQIDIVQDIGNIAHTVFAARCFAIPIHYPEDTRTVEKLHEELAHAFEYVYLDLEASKSYKKRILAHKAKDDLQGKIQEVIKTAHYFRSNRHKCDPFPEPGFGRELVARLAERKNVNDAIREIIPAAAAAAVAQSQAWAQMMHFHLSANDTHWDKIAMHARPKGDFEELKRCVLEGLFLSTQFYVHLNRKKEKKDLKKKKDVDGNKDMNGNNNVPSSNAGHGIELENMYNWAQEKYLPHCSADVLKLRNLYIWAEERYLPQGLNPYVLATAGAAMLGTVARECRNIRRAKGPQGEIMLKPAGGDRVVYLSEDLGRWNNLQDHQRVFFDRNSFNC